MSELDIKAVNYIWTPAGYEPASREPEAIRGQHVSDEVDHDALMQVIKDANENYSITKDNNGITRESIMFNADSDSEALIYNTTTSFSGIMKNPANVIQIALAATMNPGARYLMVSSEGNYPTGHMLPHDRKYRRQTGRSTRGDGSDSDPYRGMDSFLSLAEMLHDQDRVPTHIMANEEAGRSALGLAAALGQNSLKGIYLNGIDGISPSASYIRAPFAEDMASRVRRRRSGDGKPGELTPFNIKELKKAMPTIYMGLGRIAHLAPLPVFMFPLDVRDKASLTLGYRGHKDLGKLADHAVFHDISAALRQHDAPITAQFNQGSQQHNLDDCIVFGQKVMDNVPEELRTDERQMKLLLGVGNWTKHTDQPHEGVRLQRLALPDIKHDMRVFQGAGALAMHANVLRLDGFRKAS